MGFFKRKNSILDLSERYKRQQEKTEAIRSELKASARIGETSSGDTLSFLGGMANASADTTESTSSDNYIDMSEDPNDKKRRLAKRLMDMTTKLEDLSNQMYHLQQRLELIEKKMNINKF